MVLFPSGSLPASEYLMRERAPIWWVPVCVSADAGRAGDRTRTGDVQLGKLWNPCFSALRRNRGKPLAVRHLDSLARNWTKQRERANISLVVELDM